MSVDHKLQGNSLESQPASLGFRGKIVGTFFFLIFLAMGLFFVVLIAKDTLQTLDTYFWKQLSCSIERSSVVDRNDESEPYGIEVNYRYDIDGSSHTSTRVSLKGKWFSDYSKAARLQARFPAGVTVPCYVDPDAPHVAVLLQDSIWFALFVFIPLVFVVIGAGGIWGVWSGDRPSEKPVQESLVRGKRRGEKTGAVLGLIFFAIFALVGGVLGYSFFLVPALEYLDSADWVATEAIVEASRLQEHEGEDSTTYKIDILYSYIFRGKEYRSNRYGFFDVSSSGYVAKQSIVDRFPAGTKTHCFVNPADPHSAVLTRDFETEALVGLVPLLFLLIGLGGLFFMFRLLFKKGDDSISPGSQLWPPTMADVGGETPRLHTGEVVLKPLASPIGKLIAILFFAVLWNGIISIFVREAWQGLQGGSPFSWFMAVFLIPFVLIGLATIGGVGYFALALLNPIPVLGISSEIVPLGGSIQLRWTLKGRAGKVRRLRIRLHGEEIAQYRRGTDTETDRSEFFSQVLVDAAHFSVSHGGSCTIQIPRDSMHSFDGTNNKIHWSIDVHGEIANWPNVIESYPISVTPLVLR